MGILIVLLSFSVISLIISLVSHNDAVKGVAGFLCLFFATVFVFLGIVVIAIQVGAPQDIYRLEQQREFLVGCYNTYKGEYENDLVHSDSIREIRQSIADFNTEVYKNNFWSGKFFTRWFCVDCSDIATIVIEEGLAK